MATIKWQHHDVQVNMLTLHFMGAAVERKTGPARFSLIYFTALISGGVLQCALSPAFSAACGASGATMGLMGAFAMYRWRNKHFVGYTPEDVQWVGQVAMMNVMLAFVFGNSIGHW